MDLACSRGTLDHTTKHDVYKKKESVPAPALTVLFIEQSHFIAKALSFLEFQVLHWSTQGKLTNITLVPKEVFPTVTFAIHKLSPIFTGILCGKLKPDTQYFQDWSTQKL